MSRLSRRFAFVVSCLSALVFLGGCGGDSKPPVTPIPILTQEEADDIAQQVGVMVANNLGGWMYEINSTADAIPGVTPSPMPSFGRGGGASIERDTTIVGATMTYGINYQYRLGSGDVATVWDTAAIEIQALSNGNGTLVALPRHSGTYQHHNEFDVLGLHAGEDTLSFSGLADDTSLATIENTFTHETKWYFASIFVDFTFDMLKNRPLNRYPLAGGECTMTVDIDRQTSLDRNTAVRNLLVDLIIQFDGTATPLVTIVEDEGDPRTIFHYRFNLDDGTVVRAP